MTASPYEPRAGDRLPRIALIAPDGSRGTIEDARNGRVAIIHFMRSSSCPVCLAHLATLQRMKDAGELGAAEIIMVAPGEEREAADAARRAAMRSSDAQVWASRTAHAELGMVKGAMLQHSGTIVLDDAGNVRSVRQGTLPTSSFSADEVRAALTEIAQTSSRARPAGNGSSS